MFLFAALVLSARLFCDPDAHAHHGPRQLVGATLDAFLLLLTLGASLSAHGWGRACMLTLLDVLQ